jgi:membrane fusion protein
MARTKLGVSIASWACNCAIRRRKVEKGQPLLAIETSQIAANGQDVNTTMLATLESQRNLLMNQIGAEQERTKSEQERLTALIGGLETQISQLQAQIELQSERIRVSDGLVSSVTGLRARGYISELAAGAGA